MHGSTLPTFTLREMIAKVKAQGFNVGHLGDGFPSQDLLEAADELGFYLLPCDTLVQKDEIDRRVAEANQHQCILAWYGVDEMSDAYNYVNLSMDAYQLWREADPHRPVVSAVQNWNPSLVARILKALDILMPDHYPVPLYPLERVPEGVQTAAGTMGNRAGLWVVPQGFAWPGERAPTWPETRWMAYSAIACGAQGLIWYTYGAAGLKREDSPRGCWFLPDYLICGTASRTSTRSSKCSHCQSWRARSERTSRPRRASASAPSSTAANSISSPAAAASPSNRRP
jgi:hypothetical protein